MKRFITSSLCLRVVHTIHQTSSRFASIVTVRFTHSVVTGGITTNGKKVLHPNPGRVNNFVAEVSAVTIALTLAVTTYKAR